MPGNPETGAQVAQQVIYDFGMNNGDDVEYYLKKGVRVVGVDANRKLCEQVCRRFAEEIETGRLIVLPVALSDRETDGLVTFYIHEDPVASQLPTPEVEIEKFETVQVPGRTASSIISEYGPPLYVKIDVEHFDQFVLAELFSSGIFPPLISAEAHSVEVFALLVANGYKWFALVDGETVSTKYGKAQICTPNGQESFSFKPHSAGPFGEDIEERWEDAEAFFYTLASQGLGWKDVHASRADPPTRSLRSAPEARHRRKGLAGRFPAIAKLFGKSGRKLSAES